MLKTPEQRIWIAVLLTLLVVLSLGYYTYTSIRTEERPFGLGSVPFVPAKSHYSSERVEVGHLPNPVATVPPEQREEAR